MTKYRVGNSGTKIEIKDDWMVLDIGSGHNPHPRANVLTDRYLEGNIDRSGKSIKLDKKDHLLFVTHNIYHLRTKLLITLLLHILQNM